MSDEEEDYMSDAVLALCGDTRPGLVSGRAAKQIQKEKEHKKKNTINIMKPRKVLEEENRDAGLKNAISSDNKGFALLSKMGYKPGMAIGKKGKGRSEPVPIEMPQGRSGLGMVAEKRKRQEQVTALRAQMLAKRQKLSAKQQADFRSYHSNRHAEKQMERDLSKSQRVCAQLDAEQGDTAPSESYFWPEELLPAVDEDENQSEELDYGQEEILTTSEKLQVLTEYLRSNYFYCVWCGTKYDDEEDIKRNCPGNTAEDHD